MKNIFKFALVSVAVVIAGFGIYQNMPQENTLSDFALENIEALSYNENPKVGCNQSSLVVKCFRMCTSCFTTWIAINGYGDGVALKGRCTCGKYYY